LNKKILVGTHALTVVSFDIFSYFNTIIIVYVKLDHACSDLSCLNSQKLKLFCAPY
jgi:hypothetical protein